MKWISDLIKFWISAEFYSVGLSAFVGVAIRVGIQNAFTGKVISDPTTNTGPFMQIFNTQTYLLPNFVGCFIMAFCIANMKSVTDISVPLYKALTTGLCGCITTFSSWMNDAVFGVLGLSWYEIMIMILLEYWMTWGAYLLGDSVAKMFHEIILWQKLYTPKQNTEATPTASFTSNPVLSTTATITSTKDGDSPTRNSDMKLRQSDKLRTSENKRISNRLSVRANFGLSEIYEDGEDDNSSQHGSQYGEASRLINVVSSRVSVWREDGPPQSPVPLNSNRLTVNQRANLTAFKRDSFFGSISESNKTTKLSLPDVQNVGTDPELQNLPTSPSFLEPPPSCLESSLLFIVKYEFYFWALAFWTIAIILIVIVSFEDQIPQLQNTKPRSTFRSVLLAPLGAWIRWGLTRFPKLKALWPEMNPQTILANMFAVTFFSFLAVFAPNWSWTDPINDGINGSCSTVSTFFAEVYSLFYEKGPTASKRYCATTFILAVIIIQIIRGGDSK
eukprot:gene9000-12141_t